LHLESKLCGNRKLRMGHRTADDRRRINCISSRSTIGRRLAYRPGFELSKNKWGVDICLFIVIVITHRRFSIINNGGVVETDPPGYPRASCLGGLSKQLGGSTPQPPGNSNTVTDAAMRWSPNFGRQSFDAFAAL
jgi:hypothetical protein